MIVRAIVAKNALGTGTVCSCTGAGQGVVMDLGGRACDVKVYGGITIQSCAAQGIKLILQANSSSGYTISNAGVDTVAFSSQTCRDSQFVALSWNCASATSTDRRFYRVAWVQTCGQTNNWLAALSVQ